MLSGFHVTEKERGQVPEVWDNHENLVRKPPEAVESLG